MSKAIVNEERYPDLPPPMNTIGVVGWMRKNLFSSPFNILLTIVSSLLVLWMVPPLFPWLIFDAVWSGGSEACRANPNAACWIFVGTRVDQFFYGFYDKTERWRVDIVFVILFIGGWALAYERTPGRKWIGIFMLFLFPVIVWILLSGGVFGLDTVPTRKWGGFMLTLIIALTGIVASLPLGVVLALGRRSNMPVIRVICISFIEFWRGVPLITVLFMATVMLPLFLPEGVSFDQLLCALFGVALFSAAYMAEVVRGGLQAIPKGQYEGANSLGLSYWQGMRLIILPQALKIVIPGIVNTFIALFKDTTLIMIIGLFDLLGAVQAGITDPNWNAKSVAYTGYVFTAIVFWICCYSMSRYSNYLESKLHTGHKPRKRARGLN